LANFYKVDWYVSFYSAYRVFFAEDVIKDKQ